MLEKLEKATERLTSLGVMLGCLGVLGILALLVGSSVKRYLLGTPLPVTEELTALLFIAVSFCSIPYGFFAKKQIRVLMLWRRLPERASSWAAIAGDLCALVVLGFIIDALVEFTRFSREVNALSEVADLALWPWMALMTAMLTLLCLAIAVRSLVNIRDALKGRKVVLVEGSSLD